jgi:predicted nucleotidyltransferase
MAKIVRFDRAKNKVVVNWTVDNEIKEGDEVVGQNIQTIKQEYSPAYIKKTYTELNAQIVNFEKQLKENKLKLDTLVIKADEEEIKRVLNLLEESKKLQERDKLKQAVKFLTEQLKTIKEDKMSLEPVIKQLKK